MDEHDLANRFMFHPANEQTGPRHDRVRRGCLDLAHVLNELLPDGREKSLAVTNLEQTMFWANAAVARPATP